MYIVLADVTILIIVYIVYIYAVQCFCKLLRFFFNSVHQRSLTAVLGL